MPQQNEWTQTGESELAFRIANPQGAFGSRQGFLLSLGIITSTTLTEGLNVVIPHDALALNPLLQHCNSQNIALPPSSIRGLDMISPILKVFINARSVPCYDHSRR